MRTRSMLALLLLIPLADSLVLVALASFVFSWELMVLLVVLTGLVGMLLVRAEGRNTIRRFQQKLATGDLPANELMDGGLLIAAGAFLLTPGLVTDAIGFLLAVPVTRYPIRAALKRYVVVPYLDKRAEGFVTGDVWTYGFPQDEAGRSDYDDYDSFDYEFESGGPSGTGSGSGRGPSHGDDSG